MKVMMYEPTTTAQSRRSTGMDRIHESDGTCEGSTRMSLCKRVSRTTSWNIGESTLHEQIQVVVLRTEHEHYGRASGGMNMGVWE